MAGGPSTYTLNRRQMRRYKYLVSLYKPGVPTIGANKKRGPRSYPDAATYTNVPCFYKATEDFQVNSDEGTMTENNIMTQDVFLMHIGQEIGPEWKIKLTSPAAQPNVLSFWTVQGEPRPTAGMERRETNQKKVYAKLDFPQAGMV